MILGDWIHAIAIAMNTTDIVAGGTVSMVFILVLTVIALASKGKNAGFEGVLTVTLVGVVLFTVIQWLQIWIGIMMCLGIAAMIGFMISKTGRSGEG
jgi:hypothetical protein